MLSHSSDFQVASDCKSPPKKQSQPRKKTRTKAKDKAAAGLIQITRELWVEELITLKEDPTVWEVFRNQKTAILLYLTTTPFKYEDSTGKLLSMAAIIKNKVCIISVQSTPI